MAEDDLMEQPKNREVAGVPAATEGGGRRRWLVSFPARSGCGGGAGYDSGVTSASCMAGGIYILFLKQFFFQLHLAPLFYALKRKNLKEPECGKKLVEKRNNLLVFSVGRRWTDVERHAGRRERHAVKAGELIVCSGKTPRDETACSRQTSSCRWVPTTRAPDQDWRKWILGIDVGSNPSLFRGTQDLLIDSPEAGHSSDCEIGRLKQSFRISGYPIKPWE
nr:hypothetical protein Iba_chr08bCG10240 [Ipomoea batatas]